MRVTTKKRVRQFAAKFSDARASLNRWLYVVDHATWRNFDELRVDFPKADQIGRRTVFNIAQNRYRLIARVNYISQRVFVLWIMTHREYDRGEWKKQ